MGSALCYNFERQLQGPLGPLPIALGNVLETFKTLKPPPLVSRLGTAVLHESGDNLSPETTILDESGAHRTSKTRAPGSLLHKSVQLSSILRVRTSKTRAPVPFSHKNAQLSSFFFARLSKIRASAPFLHRNAQWSSILRVRLTPHTHTVGMGRSRYNTVRR